jgi:hypothetical protein
MTSTIDIPNEQEKREQLNVNNNFGFKKPKEQKFHYYNTDFEEYSDVNFFNNFLS